MLNNEAPRRGPAQNHPPLTPEQRAAAAKRRRQRQEKRRKALVRYYAFLGLLAVLALLAVAGIVKVIVHFVQSGREEPSSGSQSLSVSIGTLPSSSQTPSGVSSEPASESEPESDADAPDASAPADPTLWSLMLTNTAHPLPEGYEPELVTVGTNSRNGEQRMDARVEKPLQDMLAAAKADGIELVVRSAFRSHDYQTMLFNSMKQDYIASGMTEEEAYEATKKWRNVPGTSEHETGLCADIVGAADLNADLVGTLSERDWAVWLKEHAAEYGFILRYPDGKTEITGTSFEPWHYRYVGVEDAQKIMAQGLTLEEYLGAA